MKKIFPWLILITFIIALSAFLLIEIYRFPKSIDYSEPKGVKEDKSSSSPFATARVNELIKEKTITLILVGDIMLDRGVEYMVEKQGNGDFRFPFLKIAKELQKADILFGNLEGVISDKGIKVGSIYSFRVEPEAIEGLSFAGFNVLSLANNHAFDYTREALEDCLFKLSKAEIGYVGAGFTEKEAYSLLIKKIKGLKIAFLAYTNLGPKTWKATETNSGIAWISEKGINKIKEDIKSAKEKADILIVSLHSGEEYSNEPTQFQIDFSKIAIETGADLIVGHHPHVIQRNEKYKNGYIFYSLGNFIFDQGFSEKTMKGQMLEILIKDGKIKELIPKEIRLNNYFQPAIEDE